MERLYCILIGYVFGLFQTAFIYGKLHGIDIRNYGSGNAGTTNTLRVFGTKAGLLVLFGDIIKTILAVVLCGALFGKAHPEELYLLKLYAATGAILGHNFPFYLHFKGGKGIAATAGLVLSFHPTFIPVGVVLFFWCIFADALCFPWITAGLCRYYDPDGSKRTDGAVPYIAGDTE